MRNVHTQNREKSKFHPPKSIRFINPVTIIAILCILLIIAYSSYWYLTYHNTSPQCQYVKKYQADMMESYRLIARDMPTMSKLMISDLHWWAYSPQEDFPSTFVVTDLLRHMKENKEMWKSFVKGRTAEDKNFDQMKIHFNSLGLALNWYTYNHVSYHIPIWLRITEFSSNIERIIQSLCKVRGIQQTILFITITADKDTGPIIDEILSIKCVSVRLFFHPYTYEMQNQWGDVQMNSDIVLAYEQYLSGCYLLFKIFKYTNILTLEDHVTISPDLYYYHLSMQKMSPRPLIVNSVSMSPQIDCNMVCRKDEEDKIVLEKFFVDHAAVISNELLPYLFYIFPRHQIPYSHVISIVSKLLKINSVVPCAARAYAEEVDELRYLANKEFDSRYHVSYRE